VKPFAGGKPSTANGAGSRDAGKPAPRAIAPSTTADNGVALRRRDWMLAVMERQRRIGGEAREVPRVRGISSDEFLKAYYAPGRPAIIEGELEGWPATALWTPEYLKTKVGAAPIEFQGDRLSDGSFELYKDNHKRLMPFDAFIDRITRSTGNDAYLTAYNSAENRVALAPLAEDVRPLSKFLRGEPGMPWIGPIGTYTPLHFDLTNNLIAQVVGTKRVIMLPPSETQFLANSKHVFSEVHDIMDDDAIARHPAAAHALTYEVELNAGDVLYVPIGWWHQVTALDFSVTYTFTDFLWKNDFFESFPAD
jgi:hypothetical protein